MESPSNRFHNSGDIADKIPEANPIKVANKLLAKCITIPIK
jgi:hypothetical protein